MKHLFMKKNLLAASVILAASFSPMANALVWDPDGGGAGAAINISTFDWGPTSFVAVDGNTAINSFIADPTCPNNSCNFTVLSSAVLIGTLDGNTPNTPSGLNNTFEYTLTFSFVEKVTNVVGSTAFFSSQPTAANFLQIFYDTTKDANQLTGSGFNDGQSVLTASLGNVSQGNFTTTSGSTFVPLDAFNANDYTGQTTQEGTGSTTALQWNVLTQDSAFFKSIIDSLGVDIANISQQLAFISVDPMDCFVDTAGANLNECDTLHVNGVLLRPRHPAINGWIWLISVAD